MAFQRRGLIVHPRELDEKWLERFQQAHLNVLGIHPVGGQGADKSLEEAIGTHALPECRALYKAANERGITVEYEAHTMAWLLPRTLFDRVPAWFRMDERGERVGDFNLCPSNPDALDYIAGRAGTLARMLDTGSNRYFYWMDDVAGYSCHCPECARLTASDQQMKVVNAMLRGIKKVNPNAAMCYIAYADAMEAPRRIQPLDGVFLEYAPIRRDSHRPLRDASCEKNARETRPLRELLSCFGAKNSQVLEYWMDNSRFSNWTMPPKYMELDEAVMRDDVDFYRELGFESITSFGCYLGPEYQRLFGEPPVLRYGEILGG